MAFFVFFFSVDQLLSGTSQGPDPTDVPPATSQGLACTAAKIAECETIEEEEEEEDSSEYEESSDEQQ